MVGVFINERFSLKQLLEETTITNELEERYHGITIGYSVDDSMVNLNDEKEILEEADINIPRLHTSSMHNNILKKFFR